MTEAQLARVVAGAPPTRADEVIDAARRRSAWRSSRSAAQRLADAIANFDAATIETTHGFCQKVLDTLGTLGDIEPGRDVRRERRRPRARGHRRPLRAPLLPATATASRCRATRPVRSRGSRSRTRRLPIHPLRRRTTGSAPAMRRGLAARGPQRARGPQARGSALMTYDDQLTRLLRHAATAPTARPPPRACAGATASC